MQAVPGTGEIVSVEWDLDGAESFPVKALVTAPDQVVFEHRHREGDTTPRRRTHPEPRAGPSSCHPRGQARLNAESHVGLPPAIVVGDQDFLYDECLVYVRTLREAGVETEEIVYPGQPHGFMNLMGDLEATEDGLGKIGRSLRSLFARVASGS